MQDRLPFHRAVKISRSKGDVDGGGGPSIGEGIAGTGSEAGTSGRRV